MSASVFLLKDAVFKALSIFVLKAAISLHPLAKAPDPKSEVINNDANNVFIMTFPKLLYRRDSSIFLKSKEKKIFSF